MPIQKQLKTNFVYFLVINIFIVGVIFGVYKEYVSLISASQLIAKSNETRYQLKELEKTSQDAITLRQASSINPDIDYLSERRKVGELVNSLAISCKNDEIQLKNIEVLRGAIDKRFELQDQLFTPEHFAKDGKITLSEQERQFSITSQNNLVNAFYAIKSLETQIVFDGLNDLSDIQKTFIFILSGLIAGIAGFNLISFVQMRKKLKTLEYTTDYLQKNILLSTQPGGDKMLVDIEEITNIINRLESNISH